MNTQYFKIILLVIGTLAITSCTKKANEWDIDPTHSRLFKSLSFLPNKVGATEIEIKYTKTVSADKYIFEFSKDNLEFNQIVKTVEILADTLTAFEESSSPAKIEYRTLFDELDGNTEYSVRMKGVDVETGLESNYSQFSFITLAEQLFSDWEVFTDKIVMKWSPTDRVTHISLYDVVSGEEVKRIALNDTDKANAYYEINELNAGTNYRVVIYNNDIERGNKVLKTSGLAGGIIIRVETTSNIPTLILDAIAQQKTNIILLFKGNETYNLSTLTLPAGISNISLTGEVAPGESQPILNLKELKLSDVIFGKVLFENLKLIGTNVDGDYLVNLATNGLEVEEYSFSNCYISNYRSAVRLANNSISLKNIVFDNCDIHRIGGYGLVNIAGSTPIVDLISIKNSTLTELSTQLMDVRTKVKAVYIGKSTFYNQNTAYTQLLRFDTNNLPLLFTSEYNLLAGNNSGAKINATSYDHATRALSIDFSGSIRTNELQINSTARDFTGISIYPGTAADLFVDPANRDFSIKPTANFSGRGSVGDPRWY